MPRLLAAPDKFRGTATASEVAGAMAQAASEAGWECETVPVSDGGEGLLECFGGANRTTTVAGPLGDPVVAGWRLDGDRAVIEMARASGLALVGAANDPLRADTTGTGQLVAAALAAGARKVIVGVGGSASTDGGLGAVEVLREHAPLRGVIVAADVRTTFVDAARVFAPQKGASAAQVDTLTARLHHRAERYAAEFGVDVRDLPGSGAAGGLGGGLAALEAVIVPGFDIVAATLSLAERVVAADLVVTGEGCFDATSQLGKATEGVLRLCATEFTPGGLVAGQITAAPPPGVTAVDLTRRFGARAARLAPLPCVRAATAGMLARRG